MSVREAVIVLHSRGARVAIEQSCRIAHGSVGNLEFNNTADCARAVARCRLRYVLIDNLTLLCADLASSKGAPSVACADLLRVPAEALWVEWSGEPWKNALQEYGFRLRVDDAQAAGRRGAWIQWGLDGHRRAGEQR